MVDTAAMAPMTTARLVADGVLDGELAALLWLLLEGGVPLTVTGSADADLRSAVAGALLGTDPDQRWVVLDADVETPTTERLAALLLGGAGVGVSLAASDLRDALKRLSAAPASLPEDAQRRLGMVVVLEMAGPGPRCSAVHYLRPAERDAEGHIQRRPPAVLAAWDEHDDRYEHYAWGITPELADRVDRTQADLEDRQRERAAFLESLASAADDPASAGLVRSFLAAEPERVPAPSREKATPSPFDHGLTDPHQH